MCRKRGFPAIQHVLESVADQRLRVDIIWLPMLRHDNSVAAVEAASECDDPRVTYFWDPDRTIGRHWAMVLGAPRIAWDVYLIYGVGRHWPNEPEIPNFCMDQLGNVEIEGSRPLDPEGLLSAVRYWLDQGK